jgi:hypothetical protein
VTRRRLVLALVLLTGCHSRGAGSAASTRDHATRVKNPVTGQDPARANVSKPKSASSTGAKKATHPSPTTVPHGEGDPASRTFLYEVTATQSNLPRQPQQYSLAASVADQADGGFTVTWTDAHDSGEGGGRPPDSHVVEKRAAGWTGTFLPGESGHWAGVAWQPAPLLVPDRYENSRTWTIDSEFNGEQYGAAVHDHLTGTVQLVGQKQVSVAGKPCTAWVLHEDWRTERTEGPNSGVSTGTGDLWWCPDLRVVVKAVTDVQMPWYWQTSTMQMHNETVIHDLTGS